MPLESFYSTAAQLFFALLGFWWVVVQFRHGLWSRDPARRRLAYTISLHFLLPGVMCVVALLSEQVSFVWNIAFAIAGLCGVVATFFSAYTPLVREGSFAMGYLGQGLAIGVYALITVLALFPGLPSMLGFNILPLIVEGILLVLISLLGVTMAWFLFMEPE
jgi:hypothetical protein